MIVLERKLDIRRDASARVLFGSFALAALVTGVILVLSGQNPVNVYQQVFEAGFIRPGALSSTLLSATPLVFTGLCAALAFRMKIWNIGGEGQLYIGAVGAAGAGLALGGNVPGFVVVIAMIASGMASAATWAFIPGILKIRLKTNEILISLMLNFVAGFFIYYLIFDSKSFWRDTTSPTGRVYPQGRMTDESAFWPAIHIGGLSVPLGFLLGVLAAAILLGVFRSTTFGFRVRVISDSPEAGRYAGMSRTAMVLAVILLSGAMAGIGGASLVGDFAHRLEPTALQQAAYGYTGIVVAALARYNPVGVVVGSILLGALSNAGFTLQGPTFPLGLVGTIQGVFLFFALGGEIFTLYRVRVRRPPRTLSAAPPVDEGCGSSVLEREEPNLAESGAQEGWS